MRGSKWELAALLAVAALVLSAGIGLRDPWPPDEPRYALVGIEMAETGSYLVPTRNGELYPDKPPVFFWLIAAAFTATGSLRLSFLLPSLVAGFGTLLLVWDTGRRLWNRRVGIWAAAALLASLQFTLQARTAQIDAVLTALTTLALAGLLRHLLLGPAWGWWTISFAAMGVGVITKGVGFLPLLVLLPWGWARWRGWASVPRFRFPIGRTLLGPLAMLAAISVWLVPMLLAASSDPALAAYRDNILLKQTGQRYAAAWHHHRWFGYYLLQVAPWAWMPLTLALPAAIGAWRRRLRREDARTLLLLGWVALVLVFFSLSPGKRGVYILPVLPALALAMAPLLPALTRRPGIRRLARGAAFGLGGLVLTVAAILPSLARAKDARFTDLGIDPRLLLAPLVVLGVAVLVVAATIGRRRPLAALALGLGLLWGVVGWWIDPVANAGRSPASFMARAWQRVGPDGAIGMVDWREQFVLLSERPVTTFGYERDCDEEVFDAAAWMLADEGRRLLVPETRLATCFEAARTERLGPRHGHVWHLVGPDALTPNCHAAAAGRRVTGSTAAARQPQRPGVRAKTAAPAPS